MLQIGSSVIHLLMDLFVEAVVLKENSYIPFLNNCALYQNTALLAYIVSVV